jgi:type VI secretion system protein ImpE
MTAKELYKAGKLKEAVQALNAEVRDNPTDAKRRTFLFELLCFSGDFVRAEKQLHVLSQDSSEAQLATVLYLSALHAERTRQDLFQKKEFPADSTESDAFSGTINGQAFTAIADGDPRIGPRLEVYAAGAYLWIPYKHIESIEMEAPSKLRDLLWIPALVRTGPAFKGMELGEVMLPAMTVFACNHADDSVRLGRTTVWEQEDSVVVPLGQKMFLVDDEEFPILEVRKIEFQHPETGEAAS